jgi:hypothetical protein
MTHCGTRVSFRPDAKRLDNRSFGRTGFHYCVKRLRRFSSRSEFAEKRKDVLSFLDGAKGQIGAPDPRSKPGDPARPARLFPKWRVGRHRAATSVCLAQSGHLALPAEAAQMFVLLVTTMDELNADCEGFAMIAVPAGMRLPGTALLLYPVGAM